MNKKIEEGICPICGGKLSGTLEDHGGKEENGVVCENGCDIDFAVLKPKDQIIELYKRKEMLRKYTLGQISRIVGVSKQYVSQVISKYLTRDK